MTAASRSQGDGAPLFVLGIATPKHLICCSSWRRCDNYNLRTTGLGSNDGNRIGDVRRSQPIAVVVCMAPSPGSVNQKVTSLASLKPLSLLLHRLQSFTTTGIRPDSPPATAAEPTP